jgi:serine/threonine-protein kinase
MRAQHIGRYELLDELSRGGMGVVYRAKDPLIDRIVAIKTIGMGLSRVESETFDKRFDLEARSAGRLNHPNIVTIYDMGRSDDGAYIAMEFLDGRSLRDILDSGVVLDPPRVAHIAVQIADALAYAHEHDVIHCDIKPANVMVLASGRVKITDFGIARLPTGSRTFAGNVFGSPRYISPEQILDRKVDSRSDIFSLGAVIYEMLTGVPPFGGGQLDEILFQVINDKPDSPSKRNAAIPPAFDAIVDRALAKDPGDRYARASDMAADLRKLVVESVQAAAASSLPVVAAPRRRRSKRRDSTTTVLISGPDGDGITDGSMRALDVRAIGSRRIRRAALIVGVPVLVAAAVGGWAIFGGRDARVPNNAIATVAGNGPAPTASVEKVAAPVAPALAVPAVAAVTAPAPVTTLAADAPKPAAKPQARLTLAVTPWGEVFVDGRKRGVSPPLTELYLAPGRHTIEIRNTTFASHSETVDVLADANVRIKHKFE